MRGSRSQRRDRPFLPRRGRRCPVPSRAYRAVRRLPLRSSRRHPSWSPTRIRRWRRASRSCRRAEETAGSSVRCRASSACWPESARSWALSAFHRSSAASADGARSLDSASCTRPFSWKTCGWRRSSFSTTVRSESSIVNSPPSAASCARNTPSKMWSPISSLQRVHVAALDRVDHFVRFFEHEMRQRVERLIAIPRTALGRPQRPHDGHELLEAFVRLSHLCLRAFVDLRGLNVNIRLLCLIRTSTSRPSCSRSRRRPPCISAIASSRDRPSRRRSTCRPPAR